MVDNRPDRNWWSCFPGCVPDSDFAYRIVLHPDSHKVTWHTLECRTGQNARSRRTAFTPDQRNKALNDKSIQTTGHASYSLPRNHMAQCCLGRVTRDANKYTPTQARRLFATARAAGLVAGNGSTPIPMVVGTPTTLLGSDIDYHKRTAYVADGACGFAWVVIRPGNSSLARHAVRQGIGSSHYRGGISIWIDDHGQSVDRKRNHARAYADILRGEGINAYAESRLD